MYIYKVSIPTLHDNLIEMEYHDFFIRSKNIPTFSEIRNLCAKLHESHKRFGLYSGIWQKCLNTIGSSRPIDWIISDQSLIHHAISVQIDLFANTTKNLFSIKISKLVIHDIN